MKRLADKSRGAAPWLRARVLSNFKTRFFDKLARTLRRWQGPDTFSFDYSRPWDVRPRFYASVRDRLEWIGWKRTENTLFRPFTWQCIFVHIRKQPATLGIGIITTSNRVLTHFSSIFFSLSFLFFFFSFFFPREREISLTIFQHLCQYLVTRTCFERNEDSNFLGRVRKRKKSRMESEMREWRERFPRDSHGWWKLRAMDVASLRGDASTRKLKN